jgi:hypothetical protein
LIAPVQSRRREVGDIGDAFVGKRFHHGVVAAICQIIKILNANDLADPAPFLDLRGRDIAEPDMTNETPRLKLSGNCQGLFDRPFAGGVVPEHAPQVNNLEHIKTKVSLALDSESIPLDVLAHWPRRWVAEGKCRIGLRPANKYPS